MRALLVTSAFALVAMSSTALAGEMTFKGTLIDTKCYSMAPDKNAANDHAMKDGSIAANCAAACAMMGIPVALLVDGKAMTLAAPAPAFADYMAKEATVTGIEVNGMIVPTKAMVDGEEIDVQGMM